MSHLVSAARRLLPATLTAVLVCSAAALLPAAAAANPATDAALNAFVMAIDASPDWVATSKGLTTDATGASVLTGLSIQSANAGMTITADTLAVTKGSTGSDGRYAAAKVIGSKVTLAAGPLSVTLANVELDDFAAPGGLGFVFDPAKPFSSLVSAYGLLAKAHVGQAHAASLAVTETLAATTSRVTYNDLTLARLDGGRITTLSAGPLTMESPIADKLNRQPLVSVTTAHADAKDINLAALLHVYNSPPAAGSPRPLQAAVANVTYRDTTLTVPGIALKLGTISMDDLKVRPPLGDVATAVNQSLLAPFKDNATGGDPAGLINMLSAYSVGKFSAAPIDVKATGIDTFHLDGLTVANLSLDGLGELDFNGFAVGVSSVGTFKAGKIAVGGITFPAADVLEAGIRAAGAGAKVDVSTLVPTLGFTEFGGLDAEVNGFPSTKLGKLRLDFANQIGNVPTSVKLDLQGADLDSVLLPSPLREQLAHYGYQRVVADAAAQIVWNEAKKTTTVSGLKLAVKDAGTVTIDAVLNGPSRDDIAGLGSTANLPSFPDKLSLVSGTLSFKDDSIVNRVLADQAAGLKVDPNTFRDQFARGLPFMLLPVGSSDFQKKAGPVFQDFIRSPGSISFTAMPSMPIALPTLIASARSSGVFNLPNVLSLSVTGTPGPKPPAAPASSAPGAGSSAPAQNPAPAPSAPAPVAPAPVIPTPAPPLPTPGGPAAPPK